jgi:hypothetical protein
MLRRKQDLPILHSNFKEQNQGLISVQRYELFIYKGAENIKDRINQREKI